MMFAPCERGWKPRKAPADVIRGMQEEQQQAEAVRAQLTKQPSTLTTENLTAHTVTEAIKGTSKPFRKMDNDARS